MRAFSRFSLILVSIFIISAGTALALTVPLGTNITIPNGMSQGAYPNILPGCVQNPSWALEGFYLNGSYLTLVSGFNLAQGNEGYKSGDIFLDINGDAVYPGNPNSNPPKNYGYEYVLHIEDWTSPTFDVYNISGLNTSYSWPPVGFSQNNGSMPFKYNDTNVGDDGAFEVPNAGGQFEYDASFSDLNVNPNYHYAAQFDLSFLKGFYDYSGSFISHFTIGCGNADLMGKSSAPVPEPATLMLLGSGLLGLAGFRKKIKK